MAILDDRMYHKLKPLEPHFGALDLNNPRTISKNATIPDPVISTISAWCSEGR